MANKNLLTYNSKISKVREDYYSPIAVFPITGIQISKIFVFLSRADVWPNEGNPEEPKQDQKYLKSIFKNIFALKQVTANEISPVIPRIDWSSGLGYTHYTDNNDMFRRNSDGTFFNKFYVRNSYNQVFKCLWNNNGGVSSIMPFFQPGTYGSNNIFYGGDTTTGGDGYKWKYIYTIDTGLRRTFMDANWMPVPVGKNIPGPVFNTKTYLPTSIQVGAWGGDIEVINVINGGYGYSTSVAINVNITGDGTGASASAVLTDGVITNIVVNDPGMNYTYANVTITSASGTGAQAIAPVSPIGGHGFNPISDFGCAHVMMTAEFNSDENGLIPTSIDYRQVGLLINPTEKKTYPNPADGAIYPAYTDLIVAPGFGQFINDEIIYQGSTLETATFTATVLNFNVVTNKISVINITGTPKHDSPIFADSSGTVRTLLNTTSPDILLPSGYLAYIENRSSIQRSIDGIEQFKFVLGY